MIRRLVALVMVSAMLSPNVHAALGDNDPTFQFYADDIVDTEEPTGLTKANPGSLTDPSVAGAGDTYLDCNGTTHGVMFTTATPPGEVGTGNITVVFKAQLDTSTAGDVLAEFYDGTGTVNSATGIQIVNATGTSRSVGIALPPTAYTTERISSALNATTLGTPFIIAIRRTGTTWTLWIDADASGGMVQDTPSTNTIEQTAAITELGDFAFCSTRAGTVPFDGRIYWVTIFETAVSDADLQLAAWDDEANLKAAWLGAPPAGNLLLRRRRAANDDHIEQQPLRAVGF